MVQHRKNMKDNIVEDNNWTNPKLMMEDNVMENNSVDVVVGKKMDFESKDNYLDRMKHHLEK